MTFCPNCGAEVAAGGAACAKCGTAIGVPGQGYQQQGYPPQQGGYQQPPQQQGYPQQGGYQQPPQQGGYQQPPQQGGYQQPPQQGGYQQPPQQGGYQQQQAGYDPQQGYQQQQQGGYPQQGGYQTAPAAAGMEENVASAICYVLTFITGILFLVLEPYNKNRNIRFHAFQAIFLGLAMVAVSIVFSILVSILVAAMISTGGYGFIRIIGMLGWMINLAELGIIAFMAYKAYNRELVILPIIGPLAQKQANG